MKTRNRLSRAFVTANLLPQVAVPAADKTSPELATRPDGKPAKMTKPVNTFLRL